MAFRYALSCVLAAATAAGSGCCSLSCGPSCGIAGCGSCADCGVPDCGCPDAACGCPDAGCGVPACGCPDDCGSGVNCGSSCASCPAEACPIFNCLGRLFGCGGCGGCSGELYWNEWYNDPPCDCDPCDCYGNYNGSDGGYYRPPYQRRAPLVDVESDLGPDVMMAQPPQIPRR